MGTKISELTIQNPAVGTEYIECIIPPYTPGTNRRISAQDIADLGGGGGTWGSITGTLSSQTDLNTALGLKANSADVTNGLAPVDTTGTAISFAVPQTYGSVATPETGNVTLVTTGLVKGCVQLLLHNHATTEPTWPTEFKRQGGVYIPAALNNIYMDPVSTTRINYWISQDIV